MTVDLDKQYTCNRKYPTLLPNRIRMNDGSTKTNRETFTEEDLSNAGWTIAPDLPTIDNNYKCYVYSSTEMYGNLPQKIVWNYSTGQWQIVEKNEQEIQEEWARIRKYRNQLLQDIQTKFDRYEDEISSESTPTDDIVALDTYAQALRNIPQQDVESPWHIVWPTPYTSPGDTPTPEITDDDLYNY